MNRFIISLLLILGLRCFPMGCALIHPSEYDEYDKSPLIQTEKEAYVVNRIGHGLEVSIKMIFTNRTNGFVCLPVCNGVLPPHLEKRVDDKWVLAYAPIIPLCLEPPVAVKPGKRYPYLFKMRARLPTYEGPRFYPEEVQGTYRLVWEIYETWTPDKYPIGKLLPLEKRVSNEFKLRESTPL